MSNRPTAVKRHRQDASRAAQAKQRAKNYARQPASYRARRDERGRLRTNRYRDAAAF